MKGFSKFYIDDKERLINRLMKYRPSISSTEELLELRMKVDMAVVVRGANNMCEVVG